MVYGAVYILPPELRASVQIAKQTHHQQTVTYLQTRGRHPLKQAAYNCQTGVKHSILALFSEAVAHMLIWAASVSVQDGGHTQYMP